MRALPCTFVTEPWGLLVWQADIGTLRQEVGRLSASLAGAERQRQELQQQNDALRQQCTVPCPSTKLGGGSCCVNLTGTCVARCCNAPLLITAANLDTSTSVSIVPSSSPPVTTQPTHPLRPGLTPSPPTTSSAKPQPAYVLHQQGSTQSTRAGTQLTHAGTQLARAGTQLARAGTSAVTGPPTRRPDSPSAMHEAGS
jgi:hypothetical protein